MVNAQHAFGCRHRGPYCDCLDSGKVGKWVMRIDRGSGYCGSAAGLGGTRSGVLGTALKCR